MGNVFGSVHQTSFGPIALMYLEAEGLMHAPPLGMKAPRHVAHVIYTNMKNQRAGIDIWRDSSRHADHRDWFFHRDYEKEEGPSPEMDEQTICEVEKGCGVISLIAGLFERHKGEIRGVIARDIKRYLSGRGFPDNSHKPRLEIVSEIIPSKPPYRTETGIIVYDGGKKDFNPPCVFRLNTDLSNFCPSEVYQGSYVDPSSSCDYCYASYQHKNDAVVFVEDSEGIAETLRDFKRKHEEKLILRIGKRTDAGSRHTRRSLLNVLEACAREDVGVVFPTKFLEYSDEVVPALSEIKHSLLYSLGRDDLERGAVRNGLSNSERIKMAKQYFDAGLNVVLYQLLDPSVGIGENPFADNLLKITALQEEQRRLGGRVIPIQFIPIRFRERALAERVLGEHWKSIRAPCLGCGDGLFLGNGRGYGSCGKDGTIAARLFHPEIKRLIGDNSGDVRMCHEVDLSSQDGRRRRRLFCGACFYPGVDGGVYEFNVPKIKNPKGSLSSRWRSKLKAKKKEQNGQNGKFFWE